MLLPLKQGLKQVRRPLATPHPHCCYATSIKTRIETSIRRVGHHAVYRVVMLLPLKQGLKLGGFSNNRMTDCSCYATSIKTRIETRAGGAR